LLLRYAQPGPNGQDGAPIHAAPKVVRRSDRAGVYNVNTKSWIAPSETVGDIEEGKERTEEYAKAHLKRAANAEMPPLNWKNSRSR